MTALMSHTWFRLNDGLFALKIRHVIRLWISANRDPGICVYFMTLLIKLVPYVCYLSLKHTYLNVDFVLINLLSIKK